ncbi:MAG: cytochrome c oxidase subunit II [Bacteroidetes bacterium]|nr:cytochrome c oxidase subunit II [Bacteroidota bacterium]
MTSFLTYLIVALAIIGLVQIVRIFELAAKLKGDQENVITEKDNNYNALAILIVGFAFVAFVAYSFKLWGHLLLPEAASEHGLAIEGLWNATMGLILFVFFITQPILFYFAYKYRGQKGTKALYQTHNNKLELLWTSVPAVVLTGLILYGLSTWNNVMLPDTTDAQVVEVYARQFDWTARYAGEDNTLGKAHYTLIQGANVMGVDVADPSAMDDKVVREIHLPVGKQVLLKFRSQDVIHSAFLPHFKVQMNCVPGMNTQFAFTPTKTTAQMKEELGDEGFDFVLLCNKICGAAHYNMQMKVVIDTQEDYDAWQKEQEATFQTLASN